MFIILSDLPACANHPFYVRLNKALAALEFDRRIDAFCQKFYAEGLGRTGIAPGVYFRMLLVVYFEGINSERGMAWRVYDSLPLRGFLGVKLEEATPDPSTLSRIRTRLDSATHNAVFEMILPALRQTVQFLRWDWKRIHRIDDRLAFPARQGIRDLAMFPARHDAEIRK